MSGWPPQDRFSRFEPKTIVWDSVPEEWTIPSDHPFASLLRAYGEKPGPRKIHQGTARYYN